MVGIVIAFEKYLPAEAHPRLQVGRPGEASRTLVHMRRLLRPGPRETPSRCPSGRSCWASSSPVAFTLLLNEIANSFVKRGVQTLIYLPHFISWVLLAGIFTKLLSGSGIVNKLIVKLGGSPIIFLGDNKWFPFTIILTHIWKEFGYGTIVYLAAVAGVNTDLYEAAQIDGAGHWKQLLHVTLPSIVPIIILMSTLSLGNILNAGFDQVFNLYNSVVYESGDILDTLVYRIGFGSGQFGLSSAAGLFKSLVSAVLVVISYKVAYKTSGYRVF